MIANVEGFGHIEFRYQPEFSADDAERAFYAYADLLEQLGYQYTGDESGGYYRQIYRFTDPGSGVTVSYIEDWADRSGEPVAESVWIVIEDPA